MEKENIKIIKKLSDSENGLIFKIEIKDKYYIFKFLKQEPKRNKDKNIYNSAYCELEILKRFRGIKCVNQLLYYKKNVNNKIIKNLYYNSKISTGKYYLLVLEYIEGLTLLDYLKNLRDKEYYEFINYFYKNIIKIFKDIYKNIKGFYHGDLNLTNIIIDKNKNLHIIDFGYASIFSGKKPIINEKIVKYSPDLLKINKRDIIRELRKDDFKVLFYDLYVYYSLNDLINRQMVKYLKSNFLTDYFKSILNINIIDKNKVININQLMQKERKQKTDKNKLLYSFVNDYVNFIFNFNFDKLGLSKQ